MSKLSNLFNKSTSEALGEDRFQANQNETKLKDTYEAAAKEIEPIPYAVRMAGIKDLTGLIRTIFPFLSGFTLFGLLIYISFNTFDINEILNSGIDNIILSALTLIGGIVAIILNEKFKTVSLNAIYKAKARKEKPAQGMVKTAFFTVSVSIIGSILGIYFITYEMTDKSAEINDSAILAQSTIETGKSAEIQRLIAERDLILSSHKANIEGWRNKGKNGATTYRGMIKKENDAIAKVTLNYADLIKTEKDRAEKLQTNTTTKTESELSENENSAKGRSYLLSLMILIGEVSNIFSWSFYWIYQAMTAKEGKDENYIPDNILLTVKERENRRIAGFLEQFKINGINLIESTNFQEIKPEKDHKEIGFKQALKEEKQKNESGISADILAEKVAEILAGKFSPENMKRNPGQNFGFTGENSHTERTVIDTSNQAPNFTAKVQPDQYRGLIEKDYQKFLKAAKTVLNQSGRYNREAIKQKSGLSLPTVRKYLKIAIEERNDLTV